MSQPILRSAQDDSPARHRHFRVGPNVAVFAAGSTLYQIHMPDSACPGTPQTIRYVPLSGAVNCITSVAPYGNPSTTLLV